MEHHSAESMAVQTESTQSRQGTREEETAVSHHKYCHFCQHVKIRISSMLGCQNPSCMRRFCRHCLITHLGEDEADMDTDAQDGKPWTCPICRNKCCCAKPECTETHRHCKAYRYRCSRAEKSIKRATTSKKRRNMMANRPEPLAASVVPHESAHVPSRRGDGDGALLMFDCAAPGASWHDRVMKAEYDAALVQLADEKSSPPPLEVYESESGPDSGADFIFRSGAELLRDPSHVSQWGSQGDGECAFEDDRGPESGERIMHQLFGRMHAKQPRLLSRGPLPLCVCVCVCACVCLSVCRSAVFCMHVRTYVCSSDLPVCSTLGCAWKTALKLGFRCLDVHTRASRSLSVSP